MLKMICFGLSSIFLAELSVIFGRKGKNALSITSYAGHLVTMFLVLLQYIALL